jgi:SNF2 family DNA or RNA helicase
MLLAAALSKLDTGDMTEDQTWDLTRFAALSLASDYDECVKHPHLLLALLQEKPGIYVAASAWPDLIRLAGHCEYTARVLANIIERHKPDGLDHLGKTLATDSGLLVLLELIKNNKDILKNIDAIASDKPFIITMQDGRQLGLSAERVKSLLSTLQHVFSLYGNKNENTRLKMQALDASLLVEIEAASHALNMRWHGGQKMLALGNKLKDFTAIQDIQVPDSFKGSLRHYQQEGLNWLQFLREYGLAGILADDMGLGKTVQILAHIMVEKTLNKSTHPFLVIAPTSLMVNWRNEAARFAPSLKVLVLHGVERKEHFASLDQYDLILTTYPLLPRDKDILLNYQYHTVILDEAQSIKNARAKFTLIANQLHCRYRLCLTGTPLENNLGELWSLFNFLLPGYLGTQKEFSSLFRTPIEKLGDIERGKLLARRIKPFVLRRTKQQVVTELPEKTEIIRIVELEGQQLDLYETIRVSMHDKIRKEIVQRGAEQSHILILDALLKLRQVCCDPALLKIALPQKTTHSAKREELLSMLVPMIAEGRKILLFSQFSSMLALIETDLARLMIPYVKLTGSTFDRETPVNVFQEGKVPLFLISLKAGGVGLNLTAADTVIHYDPWWNPAAENQATDRAYRIGQNKPVFVYKLITAGTVEEKIIEMQKRKSNLMQNLFEADSNLNTKFTIDDLQMLFEPITTVI